MYTQSDRIRDLIEVRTALSILPTEQLPTVQKVLLAQANRVMYEAVHRCRCQSAEDLDRIIEVIQTLAFEEF